MDNQYAIIDYEQTIFLVGKDGEPPENDVRRKFKDENAFNVFLDTKPWQIRLRIEKLIVRTDFHLFRVRTFGGLLCF